MAKHSKIIIKTLCPLFWDYNHKTILSLYFLFQSIAIVTEGQICVAINRDNVPGEENAFRKKY